MQPLSTFPELLSFSLIAPLLLRLVVSYLIILYGWERFHKKYKWSAVIYLATGILLALGLYTQIAAIVGILLIKFDFWTDKIAGPISREYVHTALLVVTILLTLIITGPGFFAFDLPL